MTPLFFVGTKKSRTSPMDKAEKFLFYAIAILILLNLYGQVMR